MALSQPLIAHLIALAAALWLASSVLLARSSGAHQAVSVRTQA